MIISAIEIGTKTVATLLEYFHQRQGEEEENTCTKKLLVIEPTAPAMNKPFAIFIHLYTK